MLCIAQSNPDAATSLVPRAAPTQETYEELQHAYSHFNRTLFDGALPACLITLQREKATCGYFSGARFASVDGAVTDEIALNPAYFAVVPLVETLQTLVHEMTHLWQSHFGQPGRGRYHNREWADKMESIGLMPSSTGQPGGSRTGDCMADYAIEGGSFLAACEALLTDSFKLTWYDRFPAKEHVAFGASSLAQHLPAAAGGGAAPMAQMPNLATAVVTPAPPAEGEPPVRPNKSNRLKYRCCCGVQVWGKPGLLIQCGACGSAFAEVS
ncbi:MAG: SprT-like domain-containing protein [Gammaproteobacteria bacterium]|jgi:predicted SprT family Zn-dependent metalloprotease|uniref:SprT-like domain-containing protein n=1 Tax=uncultured Pseudacidovorax sp. TaxID=679313 RepID=UPI0025F46E90|nr:SprT-like domain-containing protein [uncultured Pseudacidovorax sp.]